jgi:hypothetical protein
VSLYERMEARPGGRRDLAVARLRYAVTAVLQSAGLDMRRPGRMRIDRLAEVLHDAGYELEIRAVPAGELRREAQEGVSREA